LSPVFHTQLAVVPAEVNFTQVHTLGKSENMLGCLHVSWTSCEINIYPSYGLTQINCLHDVSINRYRVMRAMFVLLSLYTTTLCRVFTNHGINDHWYADDIHVYIYINVDTHVYYIAIVNMYLTAYQLKHI